MEAAIDTSDAGTGSTNPLNPHRGNKNPRNRPNNNNPSRSGNAPPGNEDHDSSRGHSKHSRRPVTRPSGSGPPSALPEAQNSPLSHKRNARQRHGAKPSDGPRIDPDTPVNNNKNAGGSGSNVAHSGRGKTRRGGRFNAGLTESTTGSSTTTATKPSDKYRTRNTGPVEASADDLTSILIHALRTPPYPDCPICFSAIHPTQPTWSCSPSLPVVRANDTSADDQQYCWTTFHVKCIGSWASKSVKDVADAWRARGEESRRGDWRCPGCQVKRESVPTGYWCFCNSTPEPKPPRLATPHSCANPCSRARESGCGHPCPLACHPGPCPPCQVTTMLECYCPRKKVLAFRCGLDQGRGTKAKGRDLSCGNICERKLGCGKHQCQQVCHDGPCGPCEVRETAKCWCKKEEKELRCGKGDEVPCATKNEGAWIGRFGCENVCERPFDCGIHKCQRPCHPPSFLPITCPRSPSKVTHCPCGTHPIASSSSPFILDANPTIFSARTRCTSPIPTCLSTCGKAHSDCDHSCAAKCHSGPCPPCSISIVQPCRCGATTRSIRCFELHIPSDINGGKILCDKPCTALRACGRHQCRRLCCPLASFSSGAKKGKKRLGGAPNLSIGVGEEQGGLHECDLICGKGLGCGIHTCEERDHKGACPPCLRSSFEELICYCGRTVLEPPIPCGTPIRCNHQCSRPPPPCGHPRTQHSCHEEPSPCPPCPFLAHKRCACGKKVVSNVKCSLENEKVSCGGVCGKLMACGFHSCQRLCHANECGPCTTLCGKARKLCLPDLHPCVHSCHAPSTCPEDTPCRSLITLVCTCGRIQQSFHCGRSTSGPSAQRNAPKCNDECMIAKRNARLADALRINPVNREKATAASYPPELVTFAQSNTKFLGVVEKAFAEFVTSDKKTQILPTMPPERRKFVHDLASIYRMDTQMIDQEPHRSVRLLRRLDTRIPSPLLSNNIAPPKPAPPNLGKLTDLRSGAAPSWRAQVPVPSNAAAQRGWTSFVSQSALNASTPKPGTPSGSVRTPASTSGSRGSTPPTHRQPPVQSATTSSEGPIVPESWEDDL